MAMPVQRRAAGDAQDSSSGNPPGAGDVHAAAAHGTSGGGTSLPHLDTIQRLFGRHDVSHVQAYVGGTAAEGAAAMGAEAFATGDRVAFARSPDVRTAAHEAAHVVQQRGGVQLKGGVGETGDEYERHADAVADHVVAGRPVETMLDAYAGASARGAAPETQRKAVQRTGEPTLQSGSTGTWVKTLQQRLNAKEVVTPPLKIDGVFGPKTRAAVVAFQQGHSNSKGDPLKNDGVVGKQTWGAINDERAAPEIDNNDAELGEHVAKEMARNNNDPHTAESGVHYDFNYKASFPGKWKDDYSAGLADPQYFDRIGWMDWRLKPKMSASAGIKAWLRGLTIAECNSAIVAIQTDTVRAAIGDAKFDERFGATDKDVPEDQRMRIKQGTANTVVAGMNKRTEAAAAGDGGTFGNRPVKKGDWCYFYNHPKYLLKHPGGAFQGENSIFMGLDNSGAQIWSGMGVDNATEQDMLTAMIGAYNNPRDEWDQKELARIKAQNGGVLPSQYDEASGEFPPTLSDISEILNAPAYTIDGTTRKGGFVASAAKRLDTTKVEALK